MPARARAMPAALPMSASMSRRETGRIWIVSSRDTSACQSFAAGYTSMTAPVVIDARKVMMATTAIKACAAMVAFGTIGVSTRSPSKSGVCAGSGASLTSRGVASRLGSIIDMQPSLMQHEPRRVVLVHQRDIMGGDHDRRARLVELDEQAKKPLRQTRIDIAGRLVGEQELWPCDH